MPLSLDDINLPGPRNALCAVAEIYEQALVGNDRATLDALFLDAPETLRYGIADEQYGFAAVAAFRAGLAVQSPARRILRCEVVTYGKDFGTVNLEFRYTDRAGGGRQSQTWVRTPATAHGGWRIVAAHVSLIRTETP